MSFGEIKKAVNSDLSKPLNTLIEEKANEVKTATASQTSVDTVTTEIGATNDTGGTSTAGSIFAKLNKLLTDWTTARAGKIDNIDTNVGTLINGRVVKSVQRGSALTTTAPTITVAISTINPSKSVAMVDGFYAGSANNIILLESFNSNSITVKAGGYGGYPWYWQVIEFY